MCVCECSFYLTSMLCQYWLNNYIFSRVWQIRNSFFHQKCFIFFTASDLKLLVGVGVSQNGYIGAVEIIDLQNSTNFCFNLTKLPNLLEKTATLVVSGNPLICGELLSLDKSLQAWTTHTGVKYIKNMHFSKNILNC